MRNLIFFFLLCSPVSGVAQNIDMTTLPEDFTFTSRSNLGVTTIRNLGQDGELFLLESHHPTVKDKYVTDQIWTNRASQLVQRMTSDGMRTFSPHDCAPGIGSCDYVIHWESGTTDNVHRSSYMIGDVEIAQEFIIIDGEEVLWYQDCTTFDQWGFWIDYVRIDFEGDTISGQRQTSSHEPQPHTPFEQLRKLCAKPPDLVS